MWCERVIRNEVGTSAAKQFGRVIDWVDIAWSECGRVLKKQTRTGQPVRVLLPPGQKLRHNDVIYEDASQTVIVNVLACEAIVARVLSARTMATLALELGNLHLPVQITDDQIIFIEDGPAMAVLEALQISWTREVCRFAPTAVISTPAVDKAASLRMIIRSDKDGRSSEEDAIGAI